jgi:hypothetical protein
VRIADDAWSSITASANSYTNRHARMVEGL